jgi:hypothetical protein
MKTIFRKKLTKGFTIIPNTIARDERLSGKARGIFLLILSQPDNWSLNLKWVEKNVQEGRDAVAKAMKELIACGYCRKIEYRNKGCNLRRITWQFTDSPDDGFPESGNPERGKSAATNTMVTKNLGYEEPLGSFQTVRDYPLSEEDMFEAIREVIGYSLESRAETIAVKFFIEMEKKKWKIKGQPIRDWMKVLFKRIEKTTEETIDCEDYSHVPF